MMTMKVLHWLQQCPDFMPSIIFMNKQKMRGVIGGKFERCVD